MDENLKKKRYTLIGIAALLLVFVLGYTALRVFEAMKPQPVPRVAPTDERYVHAIIAEYNYIESNIVGSGRLNPYAEHDVVAEASGKILQGSVVLKKGSHFSKGDVIARIYDTESRLSLQARKSTFIASMARVLPDVRIDYPNYYERIEAFAQSLSPQKIFPDFPDVSNTKLLTFLAARGVTAEYYTIQQMESALRRHVLYAPFNGSIKEVYNEVGAYVNQGGRVARIIRTDKYDVEVPLSVEQTTWLSKGQQVRVVSNERGRTWQGTVSRIADFIDSQTQARSIFVELANDGFLVSGEFVHVHFITEPIDSVIQIPRNALYDSTVYTIKQGLLQKQNVSVVKRGFDYMLIRGVEPGDTIVAEPIVRTQNQMQVRAIIDN